MRKLILFINRLFAKLNIFSKKVYYVGRTSTRTYKWKRRCTRYTYRKKS